MAGPLNGVRVIELTTMITGSLCGQMLGDMGADCIKVEKVEGGDMFRSWRGAPILPNLVLTIGTSVP